RNKTVWGPVTWSEEYDRWLLPDATETNVAWYIRGNFNLFEPHPLDLVEEVEIAPVGHLAWTPISTGLPTNNREQDTWLLLWARYSSPANPLEVCRPWQAVRVVEINARCGRVFTHYRLIQLPEVL